ncbi:hypothetical protein [Lactobacillus crispatus]|uniref:Polymerase nucleotidyl transferase domain-containing protein n=2 Tax=Lactobacillus crispatus TaxID=47770 RepID=A0A7X4KTB4_9LACO|nr:hypothetical protein [Lactobacillus crispatus]KAA8810148.1 hypothetical protein F1C08_06200 [Lactobacillus crispatus]MYN53814.1 hypothetical protein [Lactobacillus crispatus]
MCHKILNCTCVETKDGNIFRTLLDFQQPSKAVSYLKYYTSKNGTRIKGNCHYSKFRNMSEGENYVKSKLNNHWVKSQSLGSFIMIPGNKITKIYDPVNELQDLIKKPKKDYLENKICKLVNLISRKCEIPFDKIGISGSNLVGLSDSSVGSDIDLLVYGRSAAINLVKYLGRLKNLGFEHYSDSTRDKLIPRRQPGTIDGFNQETALKYEYTKTSGRFDNIHVNISPIRDNEAELPKIFKATVSKKLGFCIVEAKIVNNQEAVFVPPVYRVKVIKVIKGQTFAHEVKFIVGSRFLHAQIGRKEQSLIFAGILEQRTLKNTKFYDISLEPWETVDGFIASNIGEIKHG